MGWVTDAIKELSRGRSVQVRPSGGSMRGRIESGQLVTIAPIDHTGVRVGDVVLTRWKGNYLLHLIVDTRAGEVLVGNTLGKVNGWVPAETLCGKAVESTDPHDGGAALSPGGDGHDGPPNPLPPISHTTAAKSTKRPKFARCMAMMRKHSPQIREDGFHTLLPHVAHFLPELLRELETESDHGLRCWLLELIGESRDPRAFGALLEHLTSDSESLRDWAVRGLQQLDTPEARLAHTLSSTLGTRRIT